MSRRIALRRRTRETEVVVLLDLDGSEAPAAAGRDRSESVKVRTGIGFLDHVVGSLAFHAGWRLELVCVGDLEIDEHHSAEDCALLLGEAFSRALAAGPAPERFGWAMAPLDEALARAVVDLSGRPYSRVSLRLSGRRIGDLSGENAEHFIASFATAARMTLHVDLLRGQNEHHKVEAAFKTLALALKAACRVAGAGSPTRGEPGASLEAAPSTKGGVALEELNFDDFGVSAAELEDLRSKRGLKGA